MHALPHTALPHTPMGRLALWLLLPVLLYFVFPVYRLVPDSPRAVGIAVAIAFIALAVASLVAAGLAVFREKERSVVLIVAASITFLLAVALAVGEALSGH